MQSKANGEIQAVCLSISFVYIKTTLIKMNLLRVRKRERKNYQSPPPTQKIKSEDKNRMVVVDMLKIVLYYYLFLLIS